MKLHFAFFFFGCSLSSIIFFSLDLFSSSPPKNTLSLHTPLVDNCINNGNSVDHTDIIETKNKLEFISTDNRLPPTQRDDSPPIENDDLVSIDISKLTNEMAYIHSEKQYILSEMNAAIEKASTSEHLEILSLLTSIYDSSDNEYYDLSKKAKENAIESLLYTNNPSHIGEVISILSSKLEPQDISSLEAVIKSVDDAALNRQLNALINKLDTENIPRDY